eukprot:2119293-Pleurochrysis_carterae.AAC.1
MQQVETLRVSTGYSSARRHRHYSATAISRICNARVKRTAASSCLHCECNSAASAARDLVACAHTAATRAWLAM